MLLPKKSEPTNSNPWWNKARHTSVFKQQDFFDNSEGNLGPYRSLDPIRNMNHQSQGSCGNQWKTCCRV